MTSDAEKKLTAWAILGGAFMKEREKNKEIYRKIKKSIDSMSEDEIRMLYDLCDDREKDALNKIREDKDV